MYGSQAKQLLNDQALLDAGARLVGKTQMDELVRSFEQCICH